MQENSKAGYAESTKMKSVRELIPNLKHRGDGQSSLQRLGQSEDLSSAVRSTVLELELNYKRKLCALQQQYEQKETILQQEITALQCELADARDAERQGGSSRKLRQRSSWSTPSEPNLRKMVIDTLRESIHCMQSLMNILGQEQERNRQIQYQLACVQECKNNAEISNISRGSCMASESSTDYLNNCPSSSNDARSSFQRPEMASMISDKNQGLGAISCQHHNPKQQSRLLPNSQLASRKSSMPPLEVQNHLVQVCNEKRYKETSQISDTRSRRSCMVREAAVDKMNDRLPSSKNVRFSLQGGETGSLYDGF